MFPKAGIFSQLCGSNLYVCTPSNPALSNFKMSLHLKFIPNYEKTLLTLNGNQPRSLTAQFCSLELHRISPILLVHYIWRPFIMFSLSFIYSRLNLYIISFISFICYLQWTCSNRNSNSFIECREQGISHTCGRRCYEFIKTHFLFLLGTQFDYTMRLSSGQ